MIYRAYDNIFKVFESLADQCNNIIAVYYLIVVYFKPSNINYLVDFLSHIMLYLHNLSPWLTYLVDIYYVIMKSELPCMKKGTSSMLLQL